MYDCIDQVDCTAKTHTIKVNLFERADYLHKGSKKKKIQLVEKNERYLKNSQNVCGCIEGEA